MTKPRDGYCVVMTTCASSEEAARLATALLDARLAACVQVVPVTSYYTWQGERTTDSEQLLLIKTRRSLYVGVEAALLRLHAYETPEIVCVPITAGAPAYLAWIDDATAGAAQDG